MKVLVAIDEDVLFEEVLATLRWCVRINEGDQVCVLHVSPLLGWMHHGPGPTKWLDTVLRQGDEKAERVLSAARSLLSQWEIGAEFMRTEGHAASAILAVAAERHVDLIVVGARGSEERGFLMGSISQKVKALAQTNVLVVRRGRPPDGHAFRIIVAVDGSPASVAAAGSFVRCMQVGHAEARLVYVLDVPPTAADLLGPDEPIDTSSLPGPLREHIDRVFEGALAELRGHGIGLTTEVRRGPAAVELLSAAAAHRAHLVVMGSRGQSGIRGLLLGSVTQRVVRHGTCSVLIGRAPTATLPPEE